MVYQQIAPARRAHLHRRIGARLQGAYGSRAHELAAELAVHFEKGRDYCRAVQSLPQAAADTIHRYAIGRLLATSREPELLQHFRTVRTCPAQAHASPLVSLDLAKSYATLNVERIYTRPAVCQGRRVPLTVPRAGSLRRSLPGAGRISRLPGWGPPHGAYAFQIMHAGSTLWRRNRPLLPGRFPDLREHCEQG
jgi:hypothetical protein